MMLAFGSTGTQERVLFLEDYGFGFGRVGFEVAMGNVGAHVKGGTRQTMWETPCVGSH